MIGAIIIGMYVAAFLGVPLYEAWHQFSLELTSLDHAPSARYKMYHIVYILVN
jgi:hypothetical protein